MNQRWPVATSDVHCIQKHGSATATHDLASCATGPSPHGAGGTIAPSPHPCRWVCPCHAPLPCPSLSGVSPSTYMGVRNLKGVRFLKETYRCLRFPDDPGGKHAVPQTTYEKLPEVLNRPSHEHCFSSDTWVHHPQALPGGVRADLSHTPAST